MFLFRRVEQSLNRGSNWWNLLRSPSCCWRTVGCELWSLWRRYRLFSHARWLVGVLLPCSCWWAFQSWLGWLHERGGWKHAWRLLVWCCWCRPI